MESQVCNAPLLLARRVAYLPQLQDSSSVILAKKQPHK